MASIEKHYSAQDIEQRILSALHAAGLNPEQPLTPVQLGALDHFHTGGYNASLILQDLAKIRAEDRVLDVGAGLAGAARMLAASPGCQVDCIELTEDYCVGAELLNRLTGLQDRVKVWQGSALALPFPAAIFDVAWMQNVGMNIENKTQLYAEIHRTLKPGGRFAFQEMTAGTAAPDFPLPWATDPADSFLLDAEAMQAMLEGIGFTTEYFEDVSDSQFNPPAAGSTAPSTPQVNLSLSTYVDNLGLKAENAQRSLKDGRIRFYRGIFRARKSG